MLPADFPNWRTCYQYFRQWSEQPGPAKESILEQVLKKIGWRGPTKQWTERADQLLHRGLPERQEHGHRGHKGYDAGKKVSGIKRHIAVDTQGLPHAIHVTTANVTDRAGALAMFDENRPPQPGPEGAGGRGLHRKPLPLRCKACWETRWKWCNATNCTPSWCCRSDGWWSGLSPGWEKCRRLWKNCERKLNTSRQMVVLAFMVLILKRL